MLGCPAERKVFRSSRRISPKKCLAALLLVAVLAVSCCIILNGSGESEAANPPDVVHVANKWEYIDEIRAGETKDYGEGETASYINGVLTLTNFSGTSYSGKYGDDNTKKSACIYADGSITLVFEGNRSTVTFAAGSSKYPSNYGIYVNGDLTIKNRISVDATVHFEHGTIRSSEEAAGIYCTGKLTVINESKNHFFLYASGGTQSFNDGSGKESFKTYGISCAYAEIGSAANDNRLTVSAIGGDITTAPNGGIVHSIGIYSDSGSIDIRGNTELTGKEGYTKKGAVGGKIDISSYRGGAYPVISAGIYSKGTFTYNPTNADRFIECIGGDIFNSTGTGGKGGISYGIHADNVSLSGRVTANGGTVFLPVIYEDAQSYGIHSGGSITGNSCTVTATASDATKDSCGIYARGFDSGVNSKITCTAGFVFGGEYGGKSIGLEIDGTYTGQTGSNVVCRSGVSCYSKIKNAGISATDITLNGNAVLEGYGGEVRLTYTSETQYQTGVFHVGSGNGADSHGVWVYGNITVNGTSRLIGVGGEIITDAAHNANHCTYGIYMGPAAGNYSISGTGTVSAEGGETKYGHRLNNKDGSMGLCCEGNLTISRATVTAAGGNVCKHINQYSSQQNYNGSSSIGMEAGSLSLSNSATVTVSGGDNIAFGSNNMATNMPYYNDSYGAYIKGALAVSDSTLDAIAGKATRMAGLYMMGGITITGSSTVNATADFTKNEGYVREDANGFRKMASGIAMGSSDDSADITVNGGTLRITGGPSITVKDGASGNMISSAYIVQIIDSTIALTETSQTFGSLYGKSILATSQKYTVSFDGNGGGGSMASVKVIGNMRLPSNGFTAPYGKTFAGWAIGDPSGTPTYPGESAPILSDTVMYAVWNDIPVYEVSFTKDENINIYVKIGEAERRELTVDEISAGKVTGILSGTTVIFTAQSIEGYNLFYRVTTDDNIDYPLGTCSMTINDNSSVVFTKVQKKFTVTWISQDGEQTLETDSDVPYGTKPVFDGATPTKARTDQYTYTFAGWALLENEESGTAAGDLLVVTGNITYYAAFSKTENRYTATFNLNGGSVASTPSGWTGSEGVYTKDFEYGTSADEIIDDFGAYTRAGHTEGALTVSADTMGTDGMTITANWTEWSLTVTFLGNGNTGGEMSTQTIWYSDDGKTLTPNAFVKTRHHFTGWNTLSTGSGIGYANGYNVAGMITSPDGELTLYAQWEINPQYTVTFNSRGGSPVDSQSVYEGETAVRPSDPEYVGHVFIGWYKEESCTNVWDFSTDVVTSAITLYAKWEDHHHQLVHHEAVPATCTEAGKKEYWECTECGKYFLDPGCTQETTAEGLVVAALGHDHTHVVTEPTCTEGGYATHTCSRCGHSYVDAHTEPLGHDWTSATYTWSADGRTCTVTLICGRDSTHTLTVPDVSVNSAVKTAATASSMGVTSCTVSGTYQGYSYSDTKDVTDIPALQPDTSLREGTSTYESTVSEDMPTAVTDTFNTARTNGGDVEISVSTEAAGTMTIAFDSDAVNAIAGNHVILSATVRKSSPEAPGAFMVIEVNLNGAMFSGGKAKVSVPLSQTVPEGKVVKVYFINGDKREDMNATLVDGMVVFETSHFSTYAVFFEDAADSGPGNNGGGFPIWVVFVIIAVVAVAGAGAFFFVKNKKA